VRFFASTPTYSHQDSILFLAVLQLFAGKTYELFSIPRLVIWLFHAFELPLNSKIYRLHSPNVKA